MSFVPVPTGVATVSEAPDHVAIDIPAKRNPFAVAFLSFWLCGWTFAELSVSRELLAPDTAAGDAPDLFQIAWLGMWTLFGGFAWYIWAWILFGKERVILGDTSLAVERRVLGFGRRKDYDLTSVTHLRAAAQQLSIFDWGAGMQLWGVAGGPIAFDYGAKTIRIGAALDEAEARRLCERMIARRPSLRATSTSTT